MSALIGQDMTAGYGNGADVLNGCTISVEAGEIAVSSRPERRGEVGPA